MKRRDFAKRVASVAVLPALTACARAFRIPLDVMSRPAGGPDAANDPHGIWRDGLAYAKWTPSPHNTQPWRLRVISASRAEVYYDHRRLLPTTDPTGAFTIMGLAMFVEYLTIAVRQHGVDVNATLLEQPLDYSATRPVLWATLEFSPASRDPAYDRQLILERKTSRIPYDGREVDRTTMEVLGRQAADQGHAMAWSADPAFVRWAIELNRFTLFNDLDDVPTRRELRRWIRCTNHEASQHKDGLWSHCLGFPGWLLRAFFDHHDSWGRGWLAQMCGNKLVGSMRGTRTIAWWSGPFASPADWIRAGRALSRSWLELTSAGLQMHPFGSLITNPRAHAQLKEKVGFRDEGSQLWLMARLGRSETPPRSRRLLEPAILLDESELA